MRKSILPAMKGEKQIYAVIDTNVLVSSLLSSSKESNPAIVISSIINGGIIPLYNEEILLEYKEVLTRKKFKFSLHTIDVLISTFRIVGLNVNRTKVMKESFPDPDDIVFYEVKMSVDDSYLVTGNIKHFPHSPLVVTPFQMVQILKDKGILAR